MDKKPLISKGLVLGIILLFVGTCIIPANAKPIPPTVNILPQPGNLFGLNGNILLSWDGNETEEPILPQSELRHVLLNIEFWITWGVFGRFINYLFRGTPVIVKLSIVDKPEWCTAIIHQEILTLTLPQKENIHSLVQTILSLHVDDDAPAFEVCPITIQADMEPLRGPFGFITIMENITQVVNVTFTVGYYPLIGLLFPEGNTIETPPLTQVELPIGIENLGNGKTIVVNELVNYPHDWIATLPSQVTLEVQEYKEIIFTLLAPSNFSGEVSITMRFTPHSFENYSLVGEPWYASVLAYYNPP